MSERDGLGGGGRREEGALSLSLGLATYTMYILLSSSLSDIVTRALSLPACMMAANKSSGLGINMTSKTSSVSTKKSEMIVMSVQTESPLP